MNPNSIEELAKRIIKKSRLKKGETVPVEDWASISISRFLKALIAVQEEAQATGRREAWKEVSALWERGEFMTDVLAKKLRECSK